MLGSLITWLKGSLSHLMCILQKENNTFRTGSVVVYTTVCSYCRRDSVKCLSQKQLDLFYQCFGVFFLNNICFLPVSNSSELIKFKKSAYDVTKSTDISLIPLSS